MKIVQVSAELRDTPAFGHIRRAWPEIVFHDVVSNAYWGRLYSERPEFQFALVDATGPWQLLRETGISRSRLISLVRPALTHNSKLRTQNAA